MAKQRLAKQSFRGRTRGPDVLNEKLPYELPGDVKERLQYRGMKPGDRKDPFGENWTPFKQDARCATLSVQEAVVQGIKMRGHKMPSLKDERDADARNQLAAVDVLLKNGGAVVERDAMADRATESHNEHLYEEVIDKETGKRSLLFRNAFFDR